MKNKKSTVLDVTLKKFYFAFNGNYLVDKRMFFGTAWIQDYKLSFSVSSYWRIATLSETKFDEVLIQGFI